MGDLMIESHYEASISQNNMLDTSSTTGSDSRKSRRTRKKNRWQPYTVPSRRTFSGLATSGELQPSCTSDEWPCDSPRRLEPLADKGITNLPDELIVKILSNLNIRDISVCKRVSRSWQALVDTNQLQALSFIRRLRFQPISQTVKNYQSFTRGWLTGFSNRGKELAEQLDKFLDNKHFPKILFFNIAEVLTKAKFLTCQNVCSVPHPDFVYINPTFSPDGNYLVTASDNGTAKIWELVAGQLQHKATLEHHIWVSDVSFSPDGSHLVTASGDDTAKIWELVAGQWQHKATIRHSGRVRGISFSPDGSQLVTASDDGTAKIWELVTDQWQEKAILSHFGTVRSASFSPDGSHIVTASNDHTAKIWGLDAEQWQHKATIKHSGWVDIASFSPDGNHIVTASDDRTTKIWELVAGQWREKTTINYSGRVSNVSFSPDGSHFVIEGTSDDHTTEIWGLVAGQWQREATILRHSNRSRGISFSPNGNYLVTAFDYNTAKIWELVAGQWREKAGIPFSGPISNAIFSPDGSHFVTAYFKTAIIWGFVGRQWKVKATLRHSGRVRAASFGPDGIHLLTLSGGDIAKIWLLTGC